MACTQDSINVFLDRGAPVWTDTRAQVTSLLSADCPTLRDNQELHKAVLVPQVCRLCFQMITRVHDACFDDTQHDE